MKFEPLRPMNGGRQSIDRKTCKFQQKAHNAAMTSFALSEIIIGAVLIILLVWRIYAQKKRTYIKQNYEWSALLGARKFDEIIRHSVLIATTKAVAIYGAAIASILIGGGWLIQPYFELGYSLSAEYFYVKNIFETLLKIIEGWFVNMVPYFELTNGLHFPGDN